MTTEDQRAREIALRALARSMDGILHAIEWAEKTKLPGVWTGVEVAPHMYKMVDCARRGRWDDFGDHSFAVSSALINFATAGTMGLAEGLNDATVAVRRASGNRAGGITVEEAEKAGLDAIRDKIADLLFSVYPDIAKDMAGIGEPKPVPGDLRPMEKLNAETLEAIRNALPKAPGPELKFEPEVITLRPKTIAPVERKDAGEAPTVLFSLEVRSFEPLPAGGENSGSDRGFDVAAGVGSELRAQVTICPAAATAGKVVIQASQALERSARGPSSPAAATPAATLEVHQGNGGSTYSLAVSSPVPASAGRSPVDVQARLAIASAPGSVTISGTFGCNASPAHQIVLRDVAGRGVFLGGHMPTKDGRAFDPVSGGVDRPSNVIRMTLGVDATGRFDGRISAELQGSRGHVISRMKDGHDLDKDQLATWNHMTMKNLTPPQMPEPHRVQERSQPSQEKNVVRSREGQER